MKQPDVDWRNQLPNRNDCEINAPHTLDAMNEDPTAFLIPEVFDEGDGGLSVQVQ